MIGASPFRRVLPSSAVVIATLLACFVHFTLPRMDRLRAARAEFEALCQRADDVEIPSTPVTGPDDQQVEHLVNHVEKLNAAVAEPTGVYDQLVEMARATELQVESITPSRAEAAGGRLDLFGWTMVAVGSFQEVINFVDALSAQEGIHRVASIRLAPAMGATAPSDLTFTLSVEYAQVVVPNVLKVHAVPVPPPEFNRETLP